MYMFLLIVHVIVSLFLIFIVLVQTGKGEGMSDVFGGGSSQTTIFGSRTGNFLTRATTASAIIFMLTSLSLAFVSKGRQASVVQQELVKEQITEKLEKIVDKKQQPVSPDVQEEPKAQKTAPQAVKAGEEAEKTGN